jgi:regulatory protein
MNQAPDTPAELKARALRYLVRREHSRQELARKLAPHAESSDLLEKLLSELENRKQLSDERYAQTRAHSLSRKYGAAKIRHDLRSRGISDDISGRASSDTNDLETAKKILNRKYREPAATREEKAKRARFLQGRGFSFDIIRRLILLSEVSN